MKTYKNGYRCPDCDTYNETWKKREKTVGVDDVYCWHCGCKVRLGKKKIDDMTLAELEATIASYPQEIQDKADEILRAYGIALGEAREKWAEELMKEDAEG